MLNTKQIEVKKGSLEQIYQKIENEYIWEDFEYQANKTIEKIIQTSIEKQKNVIITRFFVSDAANQTSILKNILSKHNNTFGNTSVRIIEQSPCNNSKITVLVIYQNYKEASHCGSSSIKYNFENYSMIASNNLESELQDCESQTVDILSKFCYDLKNLGLSINNNCHRTWFYIKDIDSNYPKMQEGKQKVYSSNNLNKDTHLISSSEIYGRNSNELTKVIFDAISYTNIKNVKYLNANTNNLADSLLNYEKATLLEFNNYNKLIISGTTSIDNKGNISNIGDIKYQTLRMLKNIESILREANTDFSSLTHLIVYLRDNTDYQIVKGMLDQIIKHTPYVIVKAASSQQKCLIQAECMAIF